jgi:hypothetical protein
MLPLSAGGAMPPMPVMHPGLLSGAPLPPQPWGLPPDAALLPTSFGSGPLSQVMRAATTGGTAAQGRPQRWSSNGLTEQGLQHGAVSSPQSGSDAEAAAEGAAAAAGGDAPCGAPLRGKSPGMSRRTSSTGLAACDSRRCVEPYFTKQACALPSEPPFLGIPAHVRGWARVRFAYRLRALHALPTRESYDIVSATFSRLFPNDFDRAIPVISHREVDKLLVQWEAAVAALERAELRWQLTGREPRRLRGNCGPLVGCCDSGCGGCCCGASCLACCPEARTVNIIAELTVRAALDQAAASRSLSPLASAPCPLCCPHALHHCCWCAGVHGAVHRSAYKAWSTPLRRRGARPSRPRSRPAGLCCSRARAPP